ncbi:conserved hypothetical protein [Coccidioides posadasii str. Silveira]|uniref:Uncharacterized protein n=1 Tax=Coccidioides posadasii (strain RMSCC 757 / Silveira) TaxID=443226 RepID=E9DHF6_COCPS|nr:conserved hypothetical protein [Coccidioides posadasii str. Silveira]
MPCGPILFPFVSSILSGAWLVGVGPYSYRLAAQECSLPQRGFPPPKQFDWRDYFLGLLHPCCFHYSAAVPRSGHRKNPHLFDHGRGTAVLSFTWTPRIFHYCGRDIRWPTVYHWLKVQRRRRTFFSPCKNRACSVGGYGRSAESSPLVSADISPPLSSFLWMQAPRPMLSLRDGNAKISLTMSTSDLTNVLSWRQALFCGGAVDDLLLAGEVTQA